MGLFNILKKKTTNEVTAIAPKNKVVDNSNSIVVRPNTVAPEVFKLLWFADGPLKNFNKSIKNKKTINVEGFTIDISFIGADEPSVIYTNLPIKEPKNVDDIERPQYFPAYQSISPQQRWIYLNWLKNVDHEINIGYVFLFYYGLERHLFFGDIESAFKMILRLRRVHKNRSFMTYSSNAVIAACMYHKRADWFIEYMNSITDINDIAVDDIYLLAKRSMGMGLKAKELMSLASSIGFNNRRYIKDESNLFEIELNKLMNERYSVEEFPLTNYILNKCPIEKQTILANYSIDDNQRFINIPSITNNQAFSDAILDILQNTHERVKVLLKDLRKSGSYSPQPQEIINKPTKEIDEAFKKSDLFAAIDIHVFDENVKYFNEGICPYCKNQLKKRPLEKGKSDCCNNTVYVKNSVFTGEKVILTEDDYNKLVKIRNERIYRNWVMKILSYEGIDISKFAKFIKSKQLNIEKGLIDCINMNADSHYKDSQMGIYRNSLMHLGNVYEKMDDKEEALTMYLTVCYYDLLGCMNQFVKFDKNVAFLAPAVVEWVKKLGKELNLNSDLMRTKFIDTVRHSRDIVSKSEIESIWTELSEELYKEN